MTDQPDFRAEFCRLVDQLTTIYRMPNAEHVADNHNDALRRLKKLVLSTPPLTPIPVSDVDILRCLRDCADIEMFTAYPADVVACGRELLRQHGQRAAAPVPISERLPELRQAFERVLNDARCGPHLVGNIELADRLLDAVVHWAIPLPEESK